MAAEGKLVLAVGSFFLQRYSRAYLQGDLKRHLPGIFKSVQMVKKLSRFQFELFNVQMVDVELFSSLGEDLLFLVSLGASSFSLV